MTYPTLPPETIAQQIQSGPGLASTWAAAQAWGVLAQELLTAGQGVSSVVAGLDTRYWLGPAATAMADAAMSYARLLVAAAAGASKTAVQAVAIADAFDTARAAVVPLAAVQKNRSQQESLLETNFAWRNGEAIAACEVEYREMAVQNVAAMRTYHTEVSAALNKLPRWP